MLPSEDSDIGSGVWRLFTSKDLDGSCSEGEDVAELGDTIEGEGDEQLVVADGENPSHVEAALAVFQPEDIGLQNRHVCFLNCLFHWQVYVLCFSQVHI